MSDSPAACRRPRQEACLCTTVKLYNAGLAHPVTTVHVMRYLQLSKAVRKLQVCLEPADQGLLCFSRVASSSH
jgi:hypothetical protein